MGQIKLTKKTLWGGLHDSNPDIAMLDFTAAKDVYGQPAADIVIAPYDLQVNQAHVRMLANVGLVNADEAAQILASLGRLAVEIETGRFQIDPKLEDIHTNIEEFVRGDIGDELASKIHTGRSRNDQVTTDMYLFTQEQLKFLGKLIEDLIAELEVLAAKYSDLLCPGYTHYQPAMVTTLGYVFTGFSESLKRDQVAFKSVLAIHDFSPLGAAAGYGTTLPIDPAQTAATLGFSQPFANSIDVTTNRGEFETRAATAAAVFMNHLSSIAQTLIVFSTAEFGYLRLADSFTTGSSIMPQKRNPDLLELIRAKAAVVTGITTGLLGLSKGAFVGYNRDSQESKYLVIDLFQQVIPSTSLLKAALGSLTVNEIKLEAAAAANFINATGLMEALVSELRLPMRTAKKVIEKAVKYSIADGSTEQISLPALQQALKELDFTQAVTPEQLIDWQDARNQLSRLSSR